MLFIAPQHPDKLARVYTHSKAPVLARGGEGGLEMKTRRQGLHRQAWDTPSEPRRRLAQVSAPVPPAELLEPSAHGSGVKKRKSRLPGVGRALSPSPLPHGGRFTFWKAGR